MFDSVIINLLSVEHSHPHSIPLWN